MLWVKITFQVAGAGKTVTFGQRIWSDQKCYTVILYTGMLKLEQGVDGAPIHRI